MSLITIERHFLDHFSDLAPQDQDIANILYDINVVAKLIRQKVTNLRLLHEIFEDASRKSAKN